MLQGFESGTLDRSGNTGLLRLRFERLLSAFRVLRGLRALRSSPGGSRIGFHLCLLLGVEITHDPGDVSASLAIRRHAMILLHTMGAGVVSSQGLDRVVVVLVEQSAQMGCSGFNVGSGIKYVGHAERGRRLRHELHQPACSLWGNGRRIEIALGCEHAGHEVRVQLMLAGRFAYHLINAGLSYSNFGLHADRRSSREYSRRNHGRCGYGGSSGRRIYRTRLWGIGWQVRQRRIVFIEGSNLVGRDVHVAAGNIKAGDAPDLLLAQERNLRAVAEDSHIRRRSAKLERQQKQSDAEMFQSRHTKPSLTIVPEFRPESQPQIAPPGPGPHRSRHYWQSPSSRSASALQMHCP